MPGYVMAHRKQDEITSPIAVANPPNSAISAPAALTPRNFSRATMDIVKMPSGTAEPNWRNAHSKIPHHGNVFVFKVVAVKNTIQPIRVILITFCNDYCKVLFTNVKIRYGA